MTTIKQVLDKHIGHVVFDKKLYRAISKYRYWYLNTSKDTLEFFGSNLLGVVPIRYTDKQIAMFYSEVLDVDFISLSEDLKQVGSINQDFKVSSDVFNITIMYVIHKWMTGSTINKDMKEEAVIVTATIFFYRTLAALIANGFKYNANPAIVQAAYANLTDKFLIKKLGSWNRVISNRVQALVGRDSKHFKTFNSFEPDERILYAITDAQGSIKVLFKNYYNEIVKAKDNEEVIGKDIAMVTDLEGEVVLLDKSRNLESHIEELFKSMTREESFIIKDYIEIVKDLTTNISSDDLTIALKYLTDEYSRHANKDVEEFVREVIVYSFDYLTNVRYDISANDLPKKLIALRNSFVSSRNTDPDFLSMKKLGDKIIRKAKLKRVNKSALTSIRTAIMLYLVLYVTIDIKK